MITVNSLLAITIDVYFQNTGADSVVMDARYTERLDN